MFAFRTLFVARKLLLVLGAWIVCNGLIQWYLLTPLVNPVSTFFASETEPQVIVSRTPPVSVDRDSDDWRDSVSPLHRPFAPLQPANAYRHLETASHLPQECFERWFIDGELDCEEPLGDEQKVDAIWLWVNGSDSRWRDDFKHWHDAHKIKSPINHFREQNELLYSVRSVFAAMSKTIAKGHVVVYDKAFDPSKDMDLIPPQTLDKLKAQYTPEGLTEYLATWRTAQTPSWLDFGRLNPSDRPTGGDDLPSLRFAGHSEIFHLPKADASGMPKEVGEATWQERKWRSEALPTYNSLAIESRLGWLPNMSEVAVAFNDDYFVLNPFSSADFHSVLYGSVLRFKGGGVKIPPELKPNYFGFPGEYGALIHGNWLVSQRFPERERSYMEHSLKVITKPMQNEMVLMFDEATTTASAKRFRELKIGHGDLQTQWVEASLRVERWREAMLWTWTVAKLGGADGWWGVTERDYIADLFKTEPGPEPAQAQVTRGPRKTLQHMKANFERAGWTEPKATTYRWSSLDGHMPNSRQTGNAKEEPTCTIQLDECFDTFWTANEDVTAAHMFKHIAFRKPECGDCVLMALVTASGELGLREVFPSRGAMFTNPSSAPAPTYLAPPHLPLTPTWQEADFSLSKAVAKTVMPGDVINLREWTMFLLSRYLYTYGHSHTEFQQLRTPEKATEMFEAVDQKPNIGILCLNDDIEHNYTEVRDIAQAWFDKKWPEKLIWER